MVGLGLIQVLICSAVYSTLQCCCRDEFNKLISRSSQIVASRTSTKMTVKRPESLESASLVRPESTYTEEIETTSEAATVPATSTAHILQQVLAKSDPCTDRFRPVRSRGYVLYYPCIVQTEQFGLRTFSRCFCASGYSCTKHRPFHRVSATCLPAIQNETLSDIHYRTYVTHGYRHS